MTPERGEFSTAPDTHNPQESPPQLEEILNPKQRRELALLYERYERKLVEMLSENFGISAEELEEVLFETGAKTRPRKRIELPVGEMAFHYEEEGKSLRQLAEEYDVSASTVHNRLIEHGVETRSKASPKKDLPVEEIVNLYEEEGKTLRWLGKRYNVSHQTIRNRLAEHGIEIRNRGRRG